MAGVYSQLLTVQDRPARVWRGGAGKPLVLLHGEMGDASAHWRWCWSALADAYTVYAPDLPGMGGMTAALPGPGIPGFVEWTLALLDALEVREFALIGNSFGATLARHVAAEQPGRARQLVMVGGGHPYAARALPLLGGALGGRSPVTAQTLDKAVADKALLTPEFVADARRGLAAFGTFSQELGRSAGPRTVPVPTCPTLIIWGTQDKLAPVKSTQALVKELPKAALRLIENAGRMPQMERTGEFLAAVRDFLRV